jgi:phage terminase large subunit-like protein
VRRRPVPRDAATRYAQDVVKGKIVAGWLVRAACQRHLDDLQRADLTWNVAQAERAMGFFRDVLRLNGGDFEGKPFELQPWQAFIVGSLFGWYAADGHRRFRVAYVEIGKGNGKSPLAAGVGHYMLLADGEARAEVYAAATKKDQAMILFRDAVAMVDQSPALSRRLTKSGGGQNVWNLADLSTGSFFKPISSDDGQSGPRPHCGLIDELHEHKSSLVVDMMRAGTKGRRQALIFEITNSGYDRHSVCWQHHEYSEKVLQGVLHDDAWFAYVCTLDQCQACRESGKANPDCTACDQWTDEQVWVKANPNLGVSITPKYLREQVREALGMPAKQNVVKRLNFCVWTEQAERWLDMALWDTGRAPIDVAALRGRRCYAGLDLARVNDLSALALVFPPLGDEPTQVLMRFWCPKDDIARRSKKDRVPYEVWAREGLLIATEGNATDFAFIEAELLELAGVYDIAEVAYDRTFAGELVQNLMAEGLTMVPFGQGFLSMGAPTAEIHRKLLAGKLQHGGHPILRWNASNVTVLTDPAGNIKPDKERSTERIDGIVALIMADGRASVAAPASANSWFIDAVPIGGSA